MATVLSIASPEWANNFDGRQLNSPSLLLQTPGRELAASSRLFVIGVGTTDGRSLDEDVALFEQLRKTAVRVHLLTVVGGHTWPLWARQLREALPLLNRHFPKRVTTSCSERARPVFPAEAHFVAPLSSFRWGRDEEL